MITRVLPNNIPKIWEVIKFTTSKTSGLEGNELQLYHIDLLHNLLNNKSQCFVRFDEDRKITAVEISRIVSDEITKEKTLFLESLYSFVSVSVDEWQSNIDFIRKFAEKQECKKITTYTRISRVYDIVESIGFKERFRCFAMEV